VEILSAFQTSEFQALCGSLIRLYQTGHRSLRIYRYVCLAGKRDRLITNDFLKTLFDADCDLQYYIKLSRSLINLTGVLYLTLINDHYILLEHRYEDGQIFGHNSLKPGPNGHCDAYASYDVADQCVLTAFLGKMWPTRKVRGGRN
jgi:hypothetical protein